MNFNCQDVEKFIAGSDEINRKRKVITRVINAIVSRFEEVALSGRDRSKRELILSVCIRGLTNKIEIAWGRRTGNPDKREVVVGFSPSLRQSWECHGADVVPYYMVPLLYQTLPKIIDVADQAMPAIPGDNVFSFFRWFINEAPAEAVE